MTNDIPSAGLISPSDIADLAGKSRAAVSYWRKSEANFPPQVAGTPGRPLFDRVAVESWLSERGSLTQGGERLSVAVWAAASSLRGHLSPDQISVEVHRLLALRKLAIREPDVATMWSAVVKGGAPIEELLHAAHRVWQAGDIRASSGRHELDDRHLTPLMDVIKSLAEADLAGVGDFVLQRVAGSNARGGGASGLPDSTTAQILVSAARGASGVLYDPACGIAEALLTISSSGSTSQPVGIEVNEAAWFLATVRALLRDSNARIYRADTLHRDPDPELRAETVVLEPPFGIRMEQVDPYDERWRYGVPPKSNGDFAWIQHALFHLDHAGTAYVLTPSGALFRGGSEGAIRSRLVKDSVIEAIVELPKRLLSYTSIGLTLWVLRPDRPMEARARVAIVDATQETDIAERVGAWLDGIEHGDLIDAPHAFVDIESLAQDGAVLSATRWVDRAGVDADSVRNALSDAQSEFAHAIDAVTTLRSRPIAAVPASQRITSLGELLSFGSGSLRQGSVNAGGRDAADHPSLVSARHIRDGLPITDRLARKAALASHERPTESGDVLFTTMGKVRAVVDEVGGHIPAKGVYVLHLDTDRFDPAFIAAALSSNWNDVHQRGTGVTHAVVKDLEIPVLPLDEQRRMVAELTQIKDSAERARALVRAAERTAAAVLDVVRFGGAAS